jgi:hypothetical protein
MTKIEFTARLETVEQGGVFFTLPRRESEKFGTRGRVPVKDFAFAACPDGI